MSKKLYVGNLDYSVSGGDLQQLFSQFGTVRSADVIMDRASGRSKGFGFVEFENNSEADAAINALNGREFGGRALTVNEARPREERYGGSRGGGGRSRPPTTLHGPPPEAGGLPRWRNHVRSWLLGVFTGPASFTQINNSLRPYRRSSQPSPEASTEGIPVSD